MKLELNDQNHKWHLNFNFLYVYSLRTCDKAYVG